MQCLKIFQRSARVFQLHVNLAQLGRQQSRQICHRQIAEEIDENDGLQRTESGMSCRVRRNDFEISQLQNRDIENERQRTAQVCPDPRQQMQATMMTSG